MATSSSPRWPNHRVQAVQQRLYRLRGGGRGVHDTEAEHEARLDRLNGQPRCRVGREVGAQPVERRLVQQRVERCQVVAALRGGNLARVGQVEADAEVLGDLEPGHRGPVGFREELQNRVDVDVAGQPLAAGDGEQRRVQRVAQRNVGNPLSGQRLDLRAQDRREGFGARPGRVDGRRVCQGRAGGREVPGRWQHHEHRALDAGEGRSRLGGREAPGRRAGRGAAPAAAGIPVASASGSGPSAGANPGTWSYTTDSKCWRRNCPSPTADVPSRRCVCRAARTASSSAAASAPGSPAARAARSSAGLTRLPWWSM